MAFFHRLTNPNLHTRPFAGFRTIKWRAEQILKKTNRSLEELDETALNIRAAIDEHNEQQAEEDFEQHILRLFEHGGWELDYLEYPVNDRQPRLEEIRDLLENWPSWADDKPSFLHPEDFDDLESLQDILDRHRESYYALKFADMEEFESLALLALMKIEAAAEILHIPEKITLEGSLIFCDQSPLTTQAAISVGSILIEAMEIICFAERELADCQRSEMLQQYRNKIDGQMQLEQEEMERKAQSEKAKNLANIRWAEDEEKRAKAKILVKSYWDIWNSDRSRYKNQGEFARDMEEKIEMEIGRTAKLKLLYSASTIEVKLIPKIRNV